MKFCVVPNDTKNLDKYKKIGADAFIFGLKDMCSGYDGISLDEIKEITLENSDSEIFVAINKNFFNDELPVLESTLISLSKLNIKGVLFYDLAVLSIKRRLNLSLDLVWNQTHMVTNYNTCNYYYDKGVKYGMLATEITLDEMNEIKRNTEMTLFSFVMGYPLMSFSRRDLLGNYYKSSNIHSKNEKEVIVNNDKKYIIEKEKSGNGIYYGEILNGITTLKNILSDYVILNERYIDFETFSKVFTLYREYFETGNDALRQKSVELIGDYTGFFYQKTIYKVKNNE